MATFEQAIQTIEELPPEDQKKLAAEIIVRALDKASPRATDNLWYIVVGTFAALVLGGVVALVVLILKDKSTEVIAPLVTLAIGVLGGLLAPAPQKAGT